MMASWQMQQARNRFSEVVDEAVRHGPQVITRHGVETAVVLSYADYRRMAGPADKLTDFLRRSPLVGADLDLGRRPGAARPVPEL